MCLPFTTYSLLIFFQNSQLMYLFSHIFRLVLDNCPYDHSPVPVCLSVAPSFWTSASYLFLCLFKIQRPKGRCKFHIIRASFLPGTLQELNLIFLKALNMTPPLMKYHVCSKYFRINSAYLEELYEPPTNIESRCKDLGLRFNHQQSF